jgi:hypothetical protein
MFKQIQTRSCLLPNTASETCLFPAQSLCATLLVDIDVQLACTPHPPYCHVILLFMYDNVSDPVKSCFQEEVSSTPFCLTWGMRGDASGLCFVATRRGTSDKGSAVESGPKPSAPHLKAMSSVGSHAVGRKSVQEKDPAEGKTKQETAPLGIPPAFPCCL